MRLHRRVAISTGAAAGIGEATARLFAKEMARLVLVDIDEEQLNHLASDLEKAGNIVLEVAGDVSDSSL